MNPWRIVQKLDSAAGRHALGKHHSTFLFAKAELQNWRATENHRQQLVPENQASEETSHVPGPKVDPWGKRAERQFSQPQPVSRTPERVGTLSVTLKNCGPSRPHNEPPGHICHSANETAH